MPSDAKQKFLNTLRERFGLLRKLDHSQSLYAIGNDAARIYIRYSKLHGQRRTFYGLRADDLRLLEGHPSLICFLWDNQKEPLFLRFLDYEEIFQSSSPAADGQYKVQIYLQDGATEFYVAKAGRFSVEGSYGWDRLEALLGLADIKTVPEFTHSQIQTFLGAIGSAKGYDIWIPINDRGRLDWSVSSPFACHEVSPLGFQQIDKVVKQIDVIWMQRGSSEPKALFEVEHSTPIYSGLLRFNDLHLLAPQLRPRFSIVANNVRRDFFARQLNRPTFRLSGLSELCTFLDYKDVFSWHRRIKH